MESKKANWDTGIIPVKDSHTRIRPLALASGHGRYRYITVTPEWAPVSVGEWPLLYCNRYKFVTVSLMKRPRNVRVNTETAVLDPEVVQNIRLKF